MDSYRVWHKTSIFSKISTTHQNNRIGDQTYNVSGQALSLALSLHIHANPSFSATGLPFTVYLFISTTCAPFKWWLCGLTNVCQVAYSHFLTFLHIFPLLFHCSIISFYLLLSLKALWTKRSSVRCSPSSCRLTIWGFSDSLRSWVEKWSYVVVFFFLNTLSLKN